MGKPKIHFENVPFMAQVESRGKEPIQCTPVVYDEPSNCGVALYYPDKSGEVWGLTMPRNLIAAWRGTEILRRMGVIKHDTLCHAYYTGVRNPHASDMESHVLPTIDLIGQAAYDEIMSMPVPEEIIRAILDNQNSDFAPNLYPITDEVQAGTIEWREEFAAAGLRHPDEVDAEDRSEKEMILKFERLLASYARSVNLNRHSLGMSNITGALLTLIQQGVDQIEPDHVLVALAGVVGELNLSVFVLTFLPLAAPLEDSPALIDKMEHDTVIKAARWLSLQMGHSRWSRLFLGWYHRRQMQKLLTNLLNRYFPMKSQEQALPT